MFRTLWAAGVLGLALLAAGCQLPARIVGIGQPPVHIGSTRLGIALLPTEYYALHPELEKLFGQPVVFDSFMNGKAIGKQLAGGHLHFAILSAGEFAEIPADTRIELLAAATNPTGRTERKGLLVANAQSDVKSIADCRGRRFAFGPSGDLLLDTAARSALKKEGVEPEALKKELPPLSLTGRLHVLGGSGEIAKIVAFDHSVPCGVVDEVTFNALPDGGGSLLTGPSRDQFRIIGETAPVPELIVVAGTKADPTKAAMLRNFLVSQVASNEQICKQMKVSGFAEPDEAAYASVRELAATK